jgi:hypothetical protein
MAPDRQIDGNYVLANREGTIVSIQPASRDHGHDEHPR